MISIGKRKSEKQIRRLQEELSSTDKSSSQYSDIQDEIFSNEQELQRLRDILKTNNPLYYQNFVEKDFSHD
jgi:hypothetical protein